MESGSVPEVMEGGEERKLDPEPSFPERMVDGGKEEKS